MAESLLKKSDLKTESKHKLLLAKIYVIVTIVAVLTTTVTSYLIVQNSGQNALQIAETVKDNREFAAAITQLDQEILELNTQQPKYELESFLPKAENLTNLTRQFDDLFSSWNSSENPIINNSLSFGRATLDEDRGVSVLPVTLSLSSSVSNFTRLLNAIESSGLPGSELRAMDLQSVSLNLGANEANVIDYTVNINAYFKP